MFKASHGLALASIVASSLSGAAQQATAPLAIARQGSFFLGGRDVSSDTLSTLPAFAPRGTITVDQVYVRYQVPVDAKRHSVALVHGCCLTGATWETTPDGRMGWDDYFVRKGYPVYVVDQSWRGRSAADPSVINSVKLGKTPVDRLPTVFSAGHEAAWAIFRIGPEYPNVFPGTQFPVEAIGEFWKQMVPDSVSSLPTPNPTVRALSDLASRLQGTVLVSHSQSGIYPFQTAMLGTNGIAAIVSIEPAACPDPKENIAPYTTLPILILWGDYVALSARWSPRFASCKAFADAVTSAGGTIQNVALPELGMRGNSHMLMQDRNNIAVADWLLGWIDRHVTAVPPK